MKKRNRSEALNGKQSRHSGTIWWAIDPFHDQDMFATQALKVVTCFAKALSSSIAPVSYIDLYRALDKPGYLFPLFPLVGSPIAVLKDIAKERIARAIPKSQRKYFTDTVFLTHSPSDAPTLGEKVEVISKEAKKRKAHLVVIKTHSHHGLKRLFMGSFAETFLLHSNLPTLVINPHCTPASEINHILFATDFSAQSLRAFDQTLTIAALLKAKVTVVHYSHIPEFSSLFTEALFGELEEDTIKRIKAQEKKGAALVAKGLALKVKTSFKVITGRGNFDPSGALIKFAKNNKVDLISLTARSGVLRSTLVGATSREVARSAASPVLIHRY